MRVTVDVNGGRRELDGVGADESLLYLLRERLSLTGAKRGCNEGRCGACTVYLDELPVYACVVAAGQADGRAVRTVEGLAEEGRLTPVQRAFLAAGAVQCGFCTPGLLVQADDLLRRVPDPTDDQIRESLAGNLCRCTGYQKIVEAIRTAARQLDEADITVPTDAERRNT